MKKIFVMSLLLCNSFLFCTDSLSEKVLNFVEKCNEDEIKENFKLDKSDLKKIISEALIDLTQGEKDALEVLIDNVIQKLVDSLGSKIKSALIEKGVISKEEVITLKASVSLEKDKQV